MFRRAELRDADALRDCMIAAYSVYLHSLKGASLPPLQVDYAAEIQNYPTWVAVCNEKVLGGLIMTFDQSAAMISNIAVQPEAQGSGLGRALLDLAYQQARENGFTRMRLSTHALLTNNVSLYQHLGWDVVEQDSVRVIMEKPVVD